VKKLKLNIFYYNVGIVKTSEILPDKSPFNLSILSEEINYSDSIRTNFKIKFLGNDTFSIQEDKDGESGAIKKAKFNNIIKTSIGDIVLVPTSFYKTDITAEFLVKILPYDKVIQDYKNAIAVTAEGTIGRK